MEDNQEIEIAISDVMLILLRHIKKILIFGIICALLFNAVQGIVRSGKKIEEPTSETLGEYERKLSDYERIIERSKAAIENERKYINESIFMGLNPYGSYCTSINLRIDDIQIPEGMLFSQDFSNPKDYITDRIRAQYYQLWDAYDLGSMLGLAKYADVGERYIRELVSIDSSTDGILLCAYGATESDARELAKAAEDLLLSETGGGAASVSYMHSLVETAVSTRLQISDDIRDAQNLHYENINTYIDNISDAEEGINKLEHPFVRIVKKFLLYGVVGVIAAGAYFVLISVWRGVVQSAAQIQSNTGIDYIGSIAESKTGLFGKLESNLAGEKNYRSGEDALLYIGEMAESFSSGRVMVSSTLELDENSDAVQKILVALKAKGVDAVFGAAITTNPWSLESLKNSDSLLLIEQTQKTRLCDVTEAKLLSEKLGKKTIGYAMV